MQYFLDTINLFIVRFLNESSHPVCHQNVFEKPPLASRQASLKVVKYEYISIICTIRGVELYLLG